MNETVSCICRPTVIFGTALLFISSNMSMDPSSLVRAQPSLVENSIITATTSSRPPSLPGEMTNWQYVKAKRIRELRGKYRDLLTPSWEFANQKREEVEREI